jgi:hypothetical protein
MTTENRAIRIGGMVDDIPVGGVEINTHRTTSCGLSRSRSGNWTNEHTLPQFIRGTGEMQSVPYASDVILVTKVRGIQEKLWKKV